MASLQLKTAEAQLKLAEVKRAPRKLLKRLLSISSSSSSVSSHRLAAVGRSFTAQLQSSGLDWDGPPDPQRDQ